MLSRVVVIKAVLFASVFYSSMSFAVCTDWIEIYKLHPRAGGWVHVEAKGMTNMDIMSCGINNHMGLILNYNDTTGSLEGKKMLYSAILTAFASGKKMQLCSDGCDTQYPTYSRLDQINHLQN